MDQESIEKGYSNAVIGLYGSFFGRMQVAVGDPDPAAAIAEAEKSFRLGLKIARESRTRALAML